MTGGGEKQVYWVGERVSKPVSGRMAEKVAVVGRGQKQGEAGRQASE